MKERPIIFSGPMVRAILDGRKTQTRRVCMFTDAGHLKEPNGNRRWHRDDPDSVLACPYGVPGDRLWVRETHCVVSAGYPDGRGHRTMYRADDGWAPLQWTPSIHMPRWASRITLEITAVRVERLHQISEADAISEGTCTDPDRIGTCWAGKWVQRFSYLWDEINGKRHPWASNPWVWVLEFKRLEAT